jgi:hypothetical protein
MPVESFNQPMRNSSGNLAMFAAIRRASSREDWKQKHGGLPDGVAPTSGCVWQGQAGATKQRLLRGERRLIGG